MSGVPILFVEGKDDISVISNLLARHGIQTERGKAILNIQHKGDADSVLEIIPDAVRASIDRPVGFLLDIDAKVADRWRAVSAKIREIEITPPNACPDAGYIGKIPDYPHRFGVWLMHDCATDDGKLEHLIESLIPADDPLWPFAKQCVSQVPGIVSNANAKLSSGEGPLERFRDVDRIKAEVHTWLSWQKKPGAPLGAAINDRILGCDSPVARKVLSWMKELYGFESALF